jgi:hypothetical protein
MSPSDITHRTPSRPRAREIASRMRAQLALPDDPRYTWLCDRSVIEAGRPKSWRPTLLSELGRLLEEQGHDAMISLADELCERRPSTGEALDLIRRRRLKAGPNPTLELTIALLETVQSYRRLHPELTRSIVETALEDVASSLPFDEAEETDSGR